MPRATCRVDFSDRACRVGIGVLRSGSTGHSTSAVSSDGSVSGSKVDGSGTGSVLLSATLSSDARGQFGRAARSMPLPMIVSPFGSLVVVSGFFAIAIS